MRRGYPFKPLPRLWLMTDERMGEGLWTALARLPRGAGVVFRHYDTPLTTRRRLFARLARIARRRGLVVIRAGRQKMRGEQGAHNRLHCARGLKTFAVHNPRDAVAARRAEAALVFVSPVFATRSHSEARGLGVIRLGLLLRQVHMPAVALGGMDARRFRRLRGLKLWGWAGVDAWVGADAAKPRRQTSLREAGRAWVRDAD